MSNPPVMLANGSQTVAPSPEAAIRQLQARGGWSWELKWDGCRAVARIGRGVHLTNRRGADIAYRYPDIAEALAGLDDQVTFDGELVCLNAQHKPEFALIQQRDAVGSRRTALALAQKLPATFVLFDVLARRGVDVRMQPYVTRRQYVEEYAHALPGKILVPPSSTDGMALWSVVTSWGLEGLVAKRQASRYVGQRSNDWIKVKMVHRLSALVSGYEPGKGSRASTFGALRMSLWDPDLKSLIHIGSVGSGFSDASLALVWDRLCRNDHPIIIDVDYAEVSHSGHLRSAVFKGIRLDLDPTECSVLQVS